MNKTIITTAIISIMALTSLTSCGGTRNNNNAQQSTTFPTEDVCETALFDEGVVIQGVRWATRNVNTPGTFVANAEDVGMLYQWNRRKAWNITGNDVEEWNDTVPTGTMWYAENDPCPPGWRVPTGDEVFRLVLFGGGQQITVKNEVNGVLLGAEPYQIFLPTAGSRGWFGDFGPEGSGYWSSTPYRDAFHARGFVFTGSGGRFNESVSHRAYAYLVRCVAKITFSATDHFFIDDTPTDVDEALTTDEGVIINGIRWATRNVDAPGTFAATKEDTGMIFQWNRRRGWCATSREVGDWDSTGATGTAWYAANDPCPKGWRVPTFDEMLLLDGENVEWVITENDVYGVLIGSEPNALFFPLVGNRSAAVGWLNGEGRLATYWSSTAEDVVEPWGLVHFGGDWRLSGSLRAQGNLVRCVAIE